MTAAVQHSAAPAQTLLAQLVRGGSNALSVFGAAIRASAAVDRGVKPEAADLHILGINAATFPEV